MIDTSAANAAAIAGVTAAIVRIVASVATMDAATAIVTATSAVARDAIGRVRDNRATASVSRTATTNVMHNVTTRRAIRNARRSVPLNGSAIVSVNANNGASERLLRAAALAHPPPRERFQKVRRALAGAMARRVPSAASVAVGAAVAVGVVAAADLAR